VRAFLRDRLVPLAIAIVAVGVVVEHAAGFGFWNDFHDEAYTSYRALQQGDITTYLTELPVYGGFLTVFGAPFALLAGALGGEDELALGLTSIPGAVALVVLLTFLTGNLPGPVRPPSRWPSPWARRCRSSS
jgi:hypothetical protein